MTSRTLAGVSTAELTRLRMALGRLGRVLRQQTVDGLTYPQISLLFAVERAQPVTASALATLERVSPPAVSRSLGELEQAGLVTRSTGERDRRSVRVLLTREGEQECTRLRSDREAWLSDHLARLSDEELKDLLRALPALEKLCDVTWERPPD